MATVLDQESADTSTKTHSLEEMRESRETDIRDAIRSSCRSKLEACANDASSAMNVKDAEDYIRMGMEEDKLTFAKSETEKTKALREMRDAFVPEFISQTKEAGRKALALIGKARAEKAISLENVEQWKNRMKSGKWDWKTRQKFIESELPNYVHNWKMVAAKRRKILKDPRIAALKQSDIVSKSDLAQFLNGSAFLNAEYPRRKELAALIETALGKLGKAPPMEKLQKDARGKLLAAASQGILSKGKVDAWMQRIFKRGWKPDHIQWFLEEKGENTLSWLKVNWAEARGHFMDVERKRKEKGAPPSFNFVHLDVFLGWDYPERMSYIDNAERSFSLMEIAEKGEFTKLNSLKLDIGHAMHMKDWERAQDLLNDALGFSPDDPMLKSMQTTVVKQKPKEQATPKKDIETRILEAQDENEQLIHMFPESEQEFIREAGMHPDTKNIECVASMWYNPHWCIKRNYLNDEIIHAQRTSEANKQKTREYQDFGHSKTYEANLIGGDTANKEAIRDECRKPQVLHVKNSRDAKQAAYASFRDNRNDGWFKYWTSYIPEGITMERHKYLFENCFWKLKRNKRLLAANDREFVKKPEPIPDMAA